MGLPLVQLAAWIALHSALEVPAPLDPPDGVPPAAPAALQDPPEKKEPEWTGSVTAGAILTKGNSETRTANATADAVLDRGTDRVTLGFLWVYAEEKNTTPDWNLTDRKTSGRGKYDYFLSKKTYAWGALSAENDELADIKLRTTIGTGLGRQFIDSESWKLAAEGGVSWVDEDFDSSPDSDYIGARLAVNSAYEKKDTWGVAHTLEAFPSLENKDDVYGRSDLRIKLTLAENMLAQLQWILDYDNTPASGADRVDNRYLVSVGWKF